MCVGGALREEGGVASTILAVLLSLGLLLGFLALSVDVGRLVLERRELQNGADAGALAAGQICAEDPALCNEDFLTAAIDDLVDANASDAAGHQFFICGPIVSDNVNGKGLGCPDWDVQDLSVCPQPPDRIPQGYLEVHTTTESSEGSFLPTIFGSLLAGGEDMFQVDSCARVALVSPKTGRTLPFSASLCEWESATDNGTAYGRETALAHQYQEATPACPETGNGDDLPGGFGHFDRSGCLSEVSVEDWIPTDFDDDKWVECQGLIPPLPARVYLAVHDRFDEEVDRYHIVGFAAFEVMGWDYSGARAGSWSDDAQSVCDSLAQDGECIFGRWLEDLAPADFTPGSGGNDLGLRAVQMAG
jgi:hypothetical protein